jgi:hypothetical protein
MTTAMSARSAAQGGSVRLGREVGRCGAFDDDPAFAHHDAQFWEDERSSSLTLLVLTVVGSIG